MKYGFVKVAAATPSIKVADCTFNAVKITQNYIEAAEHGARVVVFPELCVTGYTCGDLFFQKSLTDAALRALKSIVSQTEKYDALGIVGIPFIYKQKLYNCAAVFQSGRVLGIVPKTNLPNYNEYYECRHFEPAPAENDECELFGDFVPFGNKLLFCCEQTEEFKLAVEICEDLWVISPPSSAHAAAGALIIANLSAGSEIINKDSYRRLLVTGQSARLVCGYVYSGAGDGESTTDLVFSGHSLIGENGALLAESELFKNGIIYSDIDVLRLANERKRLTTFECGDEGYWSVPFAAESPDSELDRRFEKHPFVPEDGAERAKRCESILNMLSAGLKKRLEHAHCKSALLGVSGGLDSTLALLVTVRAADAIGMDRKNVLAITMPCFGTTERTKSNAVILSERLGVTIKEINISASVTQHLADLGHDPEARDVTFENAQARERTQVLMDMANKTGGLVVGTGDLSEAALGWSTYNGDHMSMYCVNASVPKTLVRYIIGYYAAECGDKELERVLLDILDTPVSPELLPAENGKIVQKTESIIGPYELHDFFLYYALRCGFSPSKVHYIASLAFKGLYDAAEIKEWLLVFYRRFFTNQFKRSCTPDAPKIGSVCLSPRGDLRMPSDAVSDVWLEEIKNIEV